MSIRNDGGEMRSVLVENGHGSNRIWAHEDGGLVHGVGSSWSRCGFFGGLWGVLRQSDCGLEVYPGGVTDWIDPSPWDHLLGGGNAALVGRIKAAVTGTLSTLRLIPQS